MKHGKYVKKLGRDPKHRWHMLRTMVDQLIQHDRIVTTMPRAKVLRKFADRMVTLAKEDTITSRRRAGDVLRTEEAKFKLFTELRDRYIDREGGYTRIFRGEKRKGDNAQMAIIEFIDREGEIRPPRPPSTLLVPRIAQVAVETSPQQ